VVGSLFFYFFFFLLYNYYYTPPISVHFIGHKGLSEVPYNIMGEGEGLP
jgi:hypothetical protein